MQKYPLVLHRTAFANRHGEHILASVGVFQHFGLVSCNLDALECLLLLPQELLAACSGSTCRTAVLPLQHIPCSGNVTPPDDLVLVWLTVNFLAVSSAPAIPLKHMPLADDTLRTTLSVARVTQSDIELT